MTSRSSSPFPVIPNIQAQSSNTRAADTTNWQDFTATWYTPSQGTGSGLITASGAPVASDVIAVDPTVIPLGSRVEVQFPNDHIEIKRALDTGGAIKGNHIDVFCWSNNEAIQNGREQVKVHILG